MSGILFWLGFRGTGMEPRACTRFLLCTAEPRARPSLGALAQDLPGSAAVLAAGSAAHPMGLYAGCTMAQEVQYWAWEGEGTETEGTAFHRLTQKGQATTLPHPIGHTNCRELHRKGNTNRQGFLGAPSDSCHYKNTPDPSQGPSVSSGGIA